MNFLNTALGQSEDQLIRSFSYDSGYSETAYSNRAINHFGLEFTQATTLIFDGVSTVEVIGDNPLGRTLWSVLAFTAVIPLSNAYSLSNHEFGHGTRLAAIGLEPEFIFVEDFSDANQQNKTTSYNNFFDYFFNAFGQSEGSTQGSGDQLFDLGSESQPADWDVVITMGGLNNEMAFADLIEETIYFQKGHAAYLPFYLKAKLASSIYVQNHESGAFDGRINDVTAITNYYRSKKYEISLGEIESGSNTALMLSFSTYSLLYSYWTYISEGEPIANTFELLGIRLPDIDFYINRKGLSYKFKSGLRLSDELFIPFALERVYEGESVEEVSLGLRLQLDAFYLQGGVIGNSYQGKLGLRFADSIGIEGGLVHYDESSLFGERNIPTLQEGNTSDEVWARLSLFY